MAAFFSTIGLSSSRRSISMLMLSWFLNVLWLGINYMRLTPI
ncbi:hypothetical protein [Pontibacter harenae]|nr:hypothetical protein [Pontibacter harenae]